MPAVNPVVVAPKKLIVEVAPFAPKARSGMARVLVVVAITQFVPVVPVEMVVVALFVNDKLFPMVADPANKLVVEAVVEKKFVVVAAVPVAVVKVRDWNVDEAERRRLLRFPVVPNRFVEKKFVVVAAVPVAVVKVNA